MVNATFECPSRSLTTFTLTPAFSNSVAWVGVAQVVQGDRRDVHLGDGPVEELAEDVRMHPRTVSLHEHQIIWRRCDAVTFLGADLVPVTYDLDDVGIDVDRSAARRGLHVRNQHLVPDRHQRLTDRDATRVEINVPPPQSEHFATTYPAMASKAERRINPKIDRLGDDQRASRASAMPSWTSRISRNDYLSRRIVDGLHLEQLCFSCDVRSTRDDRAC